MNLIDAEKVNPSNAFGGLSDFAQDCRNAVIELMDAQPHIDPVHAAGGCYCWECKSMRKMRDGIFCSERKRYVSEGDFCSFEERKEQE